MTMPPSLEVMFGGPLEESKTASKHSECEITICKFCGDNL